MSKLRPFLSAREGRGALPLAKPAPGTESRCGMGSQTARASWTLWFYFHRSIIIIRSSSYLKLTPPSITDPDHTSPALLPSPSSGPPFFFIFQIWAEWSPPSTVLLCYPLKVVLQKQPPPPLECSQKFLKLENISLNKQKHGGGPGCRHYGAQTSLGRSRKPKRFQKGSTFY